MTVSFIHQHNESKQSYQRFDYNVGNGNVKALTIGERNQVYMPHITLLFMYFPTVHTIQDRGLFSNVPF